MREANLLAGLFEAGRVEEMAPLFASLEGRGREAKALSVYAALKERGSLERAVNFLMVYANATPSPTDTLYALATRLHEVDEEMAAANLFMFYVNAGGANAFAYDAALTFAMGMGMPDLCIEIYEKAKQVGNFDKLLGSSLFNVASIYMNQSRFDEAAELYGEALERDPGHPHARKNLTTLAREHKVERAIELMDDMLRAISRSYPQPVTIAASEPPGYLQDWNASSVDAVTAALVRHGFCYLRNGCHLDRVREVHAAVMDYEAELGPFPLTAVKVAKSPIELIYRFDAKKLASNIFGAPGELDADRSVVRRVTPAHKESFVPFHQDSTAFAAALINIWTPLTPAGGEFPTLELVAQRVTQAEQTLIQAGEYNMVEIAADYVLDRYKGLVYEVADARPGDCVIFLGTTIHRSANLGGAVKVRYGLEARWTQAT